jgi:hypothetical protein
MEYNTVMLNNESWLLHSDLFKKHWIIETKSWVRNLGWFSEVIHKSKIDNGWLLFGDFNISIMDYVNIIDGPGAEKILYTNVSNQWTYIKGPVLFVIRKSEDEVYIAGWAGDKKQLQELKKKYDNPWDWPEINTIEVNPSAVTNGIFQKSLEKFPVFFLTNGESNAEENWEHLKKVCPRAERVDGVSPRREAFLKCAELAYTSPYFFVVTGKNWITDSSIFNYTPDNSVPNAHIMFQAKNMSNGLEYGHMAVGCYNTSIVLNTPENFGLDFTEYGKIYPIPLTVSKANFATSPFEAWRTAFRETVKLTLKDTEISNKWLNHWVSVAEGDNYEWVLRGAKDGNQYALSNKDNTDNLLNTERWNWLQEYFDGKYTSGG